MDSIRKERKRGITSEKNCAVEHNDLKIKTSWTPATRTSVERSTRAQRRDTFYSSSTPRSPIPRPASVLQKSLALGLRPIVGRQQIDKRWNPDKTVKRGF